jgi:hypothetical protein
MRLAAQLEERAVARYEPIKHWPGSMLYRASSGRSYCAAPRGLIPAFPYSLAALRRPSKEETARWGPGVVPRMVVDVTNSIDRSLEAAIRSRTLIVAPWNAYLVLRLPDNRVVVAYKLSGEIPRLDQTAATHVAIAGGYDVGGWVVELVRPFQGEDWHFSPPRFGGASGPWPEIGASLA